MLRDKSGKDFFTIGALSGQAIPAPTSSYEDYLSPELKAGGLRHYRSAKARTE